MEYRREQLINPGHFAQCFRQAGAKDIDQNPHNGKSRFILLIQFCHDRSLISFQFLVYSRISICLYAASFL